MSKLSAVEQRMSRIANSPPPPGLEDKVTEVKARWEQVVKQTKDRYVCKNTSTVVLEFYTYVVFVCVFVYTYVCV